MRGLAAALLTATLCSGVCLGEATDVTYDLSKVQHIEHFVGSEAARQLLARQGFVVTDQSFRQIFEPYTRPYSAEVPVFITTDSAWHTYHVLLEEGVRRLEEGQAAVLRDFSEKLAHAALQKANRQDGPYLDLAKFAAVGLALQDKQALEGFEAEFRTTAEGTAQQLLNSPQQVKVLFFGLPFLPQWLKAQSFYTKSPALRGYFAARRYYGSCDFRARSEEETVRAVLLALLIEGDPELKRLWLRLSEPYGVLLGPVEDGDAKVYAEAARDVLGREPTPALAVEKAAALSAAFMKNLPDPSVNDQVLPLEDYPSFPEKIRGFRLFPLCRLPCAVLFQNTVFPHVKGRYFPSGVDLLAVGALASEAGRRVLRRTVRDEDAVQAILKAETCPTPDSLHGRALKLLAMLQEPLPEAAPAPLKTEAWQDKQCWTQLGAWAEQRHTWALHTKMNFVTSGRTPEPYAGIVSPYPAFFSALGVLARDTGRELTRFGPDPDAGPGKSVAQVAKLLADFGGLCDSLSEIATKQLTGEELTKEQTNLIRYYGSSLGRFCLYEGAASTSPRDDAPILVPVFAETLVHQEFLYAALSRPEALYVIASVDGQPVLHRGAVLSYREFRGPVGRPLNDEDWQAMVRSGRAPEPPLFTQSFRAGIGEEQVLRIIESGRTYAAVDSVAGHKVTELMLQRLQQPGVPNRDWLLGHLLARAADEDVGALVELMQGDQPIEVEGYALTIAQLDWSARTEQILGLLRSPQPALRIAAARILAGRPESIPVRALAVEYGKQDALGKRLICFVLGHVPQSETGADAVLADAVLQEALRSPVAGIRYETAKAVGRAHLASPWVSQELPALVKEPDEYVAAAAAKAVRELNLAGAAPVLLARLKAVVGQAVEERRDPKRWRPYAAPEEVSGQEAGRGPWAELPGELAVSLGDISSSGFDGPNIELETWEFGSEAPPFPGPLAYELAQCMAAFRYGPAKEPLEAMLKADMWSQQIAMDALSALDPAGHEKRVVAMVRDTTVDGVLRRDLVEHLADAGQTQLAVQLYTELATDLRNEYGDRLSAFRNLSQIAEPEATRKLALQIAADGRIEPYLRVDALRYTPEAARSKEGQQVLLDIARSREVRSSDRMEALEVLVETGTLEPIGPVLGELAAGPEGVEDYAGEGIIRILAKVPNVGNQEWARSLILQMAGRPEVEPSTRLSALKLLPDLGSNQQAQGALLGVAADERMLPYERLYALGLGSV